MAVHGIENAMVIGHSMGGKTAMQFALQFSDKVEKLVIADMAPRAYAPTHQKILAAMLALNLKSFSTRQEVEEALAPEIPDLVLRRFILGAMRTVNFSGKSICAVWRKIIYNCASRFLLPRHLPNQRYLFVAENQITLKPPMNH